MTGMKDDQRFALKAPGSAATWHPAPFCPFRSFYPFCPFRPFFYPFPSFTDGCRVVRFRYMIDPVFPIYGGHTVERVGDKSARPCFSMIFHN